MQDTNEQGMQNANGSGGLKVQLIWAQVLEVLDTDRDIQQLKVMVIDPIVSISETMTALHYMSYGPACTVGQLVLLNVVGSVYPSVLENTGDLAFVIPSTSFSEPWAGVIDAQNGALISDRTSDSVSDTPASAVRLNSSGIAGQAIKLGNMPLERRVLAVDEPLSPYHNLMVAANDLNLIPVICCVSHYQVPLVAAAIKSAHEESRVVYCMSDETGLSIDFSNEIDFCVKTGLIDASITCGQAMGGDFEAVNLYSALLAGRYIANADYLICSTGVGDYDTGTLYGNLGVAQAQAINVAATLNGTPIAVLRISETDDNPADVSAMSLHALTRVTLAEALIAVPDDIDSVSLAQLRVTIQTFGIGQRNHVVELPSGLSQMIQGTTVAAQMGLALQEDSVAVKAVLAAGKLAVIWAQAGNTEPIEFDVPAAGCLDEAALSGGVGGAESEANSEAGAASDAESAGGLEIEAEVAEAIATDATAAPDVSAAEGLEDSSSIDSSNEPPKDESDAPSAQLGKDDADEAEPVYESKPEGDSKDSADSAVKIEEGSDAEDEDAPDNESTYSPVSQQAPSAIRALTPGNDRPNTNNEQRASSEQSEQNEQDKGDEEPPSLWRKFVNYFSTP